MVTTPRRNLLHAGILRRSDPPAVPWYGELMARNDQEKATQTPPRKNRYVRIVALVAAAFLIGTFLVVRYTDAPDRVLWGTLERWIAERGGTFACSRRSGRLVEGVVIENLRLALPPHLEITVERTAFRLSAPALACGVVQFETLTLFRPRATWTRGAAGSKAHGANIPVWLCVHAPRAEIREGSLTLRKTGILPENPLLARGRLDVLVAGGRCRVRLPAFDFREIPGTVGSTSAAGEITIHPSHGGNWDLAVKSGENRVRGKGFWRLRPADEPEFDMDLFLEPLHLKEIARSWPALRDMAVEGKVAVAGSKDGLRFSGTIRSPPWGEVTTEGNACWNGGAVRVTGRSSTTAFRPPTGLIPSGSGAVLLRGEATWSLQRARSEPIKWSSAFRLHEGLLFDLPFDAAAGTARSEGAGGTVALLIASPWAGTAQGSCSWAKSPNRWSASFSSPDLPLRRTLEVLQTKGLPPPPADLSPPAGPWVLERCEAEGGQEGISIALALMRPEGERHALSLRRDPEGAVAGTWNARAANPLEWGAPWAGEIQADTDFRGIPSGRTVVDVDLLPSSVNGAAIEPARLRLEADPGRWRLLPFSVHTAAGEFSGDLEHAGGRGFRGNLEVSLPSLRALHAWLPECMRADGSGRLFLALSGSGVSPVLTGRLRVDGPSWRDWEAETLEGEGMWDLGRNLVTLAAGWTRLERRELVLGSGNIEIGMDGPDIRIFIGTEVGEARRLQADARGHHSLSSEGTLVLKHIRFDSGPKRFVQEGKAFLSWSPEGVRWRDLVLVKKRSRIAWSGSVLRGEPDAPPSVESDLSMRHMPIHLLPLPPHAGTFWGYLEGDLSVAGPMDGPKLIGGIRILEGSYGLPRSDMVIAPVTAHLEARGGQLVLKEAHATTPEGGTARAAGAVDFHGMLPSRFQFDVEGEAFPFIVGDDMEGLADFTAVLRGTPREPVFEGSATILRGRIQLPDAARQEPLPDSIHFTSAVPFRPTGGPAAAEGMIRRLRGGLRLDSREGLWVANRSLMAQVTGSLLVHFTARGPLLEGSLDLGQGLFLFQGKKFEIQDSRLSFSGREDNVPFLSLTALYRTAEADVFAHLTGPPDHPELALSSSPPLPESEILSLLIFGKPSKDLSGREQLGWSAAAAGLSAPFQELTILQSLQNSLGLHTLEVTAGSQSRIGFSKYLDDRTVVEYQETFGSLPDRRLNLRYRINRHLSILAETTGSGRTGADILWEQRY